MPAKRFEDLVTGGNELNGLAGPAAAQQLEGLFDAVQDEFEKRWSLAYGFFAVPTVAIDAGNDKVDCSALDAILDGCRLDTAGSWQFAAQATGTYYLQLTNVGAYAAPATVENAAYLTVATVAWDLPTTTLSTLAVIPTAAGVNFRGQTAQLSQWVPRGTWTTAFAYRGNSTYRDVVTYNGSCYVALSDHTSGAASEPGVGGSWSTYWQLLASKGATGATGAAGGLTNPRGDWQSGIAYDASNPDTVVGSDGHGYQCIVSHTSGDLDDEPGVGAVYATYWQRYVNAGDTGAQGDQGEGFNPAGAWATATAYAVTPDIDWVTHNGNSYACIAAHTSGDEDDEPGVGAVWETYWQQMAAKGSPGDPMDWQGAWVTATAYIAGQGVTRLGSSYYCKLGHTSGAASEPGVGASWTTYWDYLALKGTDGAAGKTVLTTSGAPAAGTGVNGDYAYDPTARVMYGPKAGGAWPAGVSLAGIDGVDGLDGKGFNVRGAWLTATAYSDSPDYDVVTNGGSSYACTAAHTSGTDDDEPGVGANWGDYWALLVVSAGGLSLVTTVSDPGSDANIPTEQAVREAIAAGGGGGGSAAANLLDNPEFAIDQRGAGASRDFNDDTYHFDRWYGLRGTNPTTKTIERIASGLNTASYAARMTVDTNGGLAQIVESVKSLPYRGTAMRVGARVRFDSTDTVYWALLEWTGTADTVTSDVVNDWTDAVKAAGNFFLAADITVAATGTLAVTANTWEALAVSGGTLSTSCNNLILMVWVETGGQLDITECDLYAGSASRTWTPKDTAADRNECYRHCYIWQTTRITGYRQSYNVINGMTQLFPIPLRTTPGMSHNISAWSNTWSPLTTTAAFYNGVTNAAAQITGALTVNFASFTLHHFVFSFTAATSFDGSAGDIGLIGFGPDVRVIYSADL